MLDSRANSQIQRKSYVFSSLGLKLSDQKTNSMVVSFWLSSILPSSPSLWQPSVHVSAGIRAHFCIGRSRANVRAGGAPFLLRSSISQNPGPRGEGDRSQSHGIAVLHSSTTVQQFSDPLQSSNLTFCAFSRERSNRESDKSSPTAKSRPRSTRGESCARSSVSSIRFTLASSVS